MIPLNELKELLLKRRGRGLINNYNQYVEEDGYFNVQDISGGNFDDAFQLGLDLGEAFFVEELLELLKEEPLE